MIEPYCAMPLDYAFNGSVQIPTTAHFKTIASGLHRCEKFGFRRTLNMWSRLNKKTWADWNECLLEEGIVLSNLIPSVFAYLTTCMLLAVGCG